MLNIKPIFIMEKGEISLAAKVRGVKKLVTKLVDMVLEKNEKYLSEITVIVGYGSNLENLAKFKEEIEMRLKDKVKKIVYAKGGACICSHTGPDIIAISYSK